MWLKVCCYVRVLSLCWKASTTIITLLRRSGEKKLSESKFWLVLALFCLQIKFCILHGNYARIFNAWYLNLLFFPEKWNACMHATCKTCMQDQQEYQADPARICCRSKWNLFFFCFFFGNFLRKLLNILFSQQKMLSDQKLSNHELFWKFFSWFFCWIFQCSISVYVKIFSHMFFHFLERRPFVIFPIKSKHKQEIFPFYLIYSE